MAPARNIIRSGEQTYSLEPRIMDVLSLLASRSGEVIARDTLIDEIWGVQFGGEDSLSRAVSILRKTFREAGATVEVIETIPKRGYRLTLPVEWAEPTIKGNATVSEPSSQTRGHSNQLEEKRTAKTNLIGRPQAILIVAVLLIAGGFAFSLSLRQQSDPPIEKITVSTVVETPERSLAVLPFSDLSPSGDQEYFSDGISEEILNVMAKLDGLYVAGRTSAFAFKGREVDLREIGQTLNVTYVLEGSIQRQADRVRIRARLAEAADGYQVWSETYDRNIEDIFAIQDEIARAIAMELDVVLESTIDTPLAAVLTTSNEAHDLVLKARAAYRRSPDAETFEYAESLLRDAVALDPDYADAWIALATLNNFASAYVGTWSPQTAFESAREATAKAYEIDPESALTTIWRANISYFEGNLVEAYRFAEQAIALEPDNEGIVFSVGHYNALFGYTKRALPYLERATQLDPLDGFAWQSRALVNQNLGHYDLAEQEALEAIRLGDIGALDVLAWNALQSGAPSKAMTYHMDLFDAATEVSDPGLGGRFLWVGAGKALFEKDPNTSDMVQDILQMQFQNDDFEPSAVSISLAAKLGMYDALYDQWRQAYATKSVIAISIWSDFEWARNLRQHEGFAAFAKREGMIDLWQTYGWPDLCQPNVGTDGSDGQFTCT